VARFKIDYLTEDEQGKYHLVQKYVRSSQAILEHLKRLRSKGRRLLDLQQMTLPYQKWIGFRGLASRDPQPTLPGHFWLIEDDGGEEYLARLAEAAWARMMQTEKLQSWDYDEVVRRKYQK
jgi:hypothetical protein